MAGAEVNYLAVLVSAVAMFVLGGLWYSALFAKPWMSVVGKTEAELRAASSPLLYVAAFVAALVTSFVLALVLHNVGATTVRAGLLWGFHCWLGFAAATSYIHYLFSLRSNKHWLIDTGHSLASFLVAGAILAVWR